MKMVKKRNCVGFRMPKDNMIDQDITGTHLFSRWKKDEVIEIIIRLNLIVF